MKNSADFITIMFNAVKNHLFILTTSYTLVHRKVTGNGITDNWDIALWTN